MRRWTALVLAGSRPGGDPFARMHSVPAKGLIPVGGMPMIERPVRALLASPHVAEVRILTQTVPPFERALRPHDRLRFDHSDATIAETLTRILAGPQDAFPFLVTTADHALLTTAMIDQFCGKADRADLAIGVVERRDFEERFPGNRRTWIGVKGGAYTGTNLFALGSPRAARAIDLWREVEQDRKKGWKMLAAFGLPGLLGLLRLKDIHGVLASIGRKIGLDISAVQLSDPLAGIDVDKAEDLALAERIIRERA